MRRLIAHIGLALSALVLVGATYNSVATKVDSNIEFSNGKELVFRVSPKTNSYGDAENELDDDSANNIAKEMEKRLGAQNVSQYKVVTEGNDTVKVTVKQDTDNQYEMLKNLLSFNGSFALTTSKDTVALGSEFLTKGKAHLDDINGYPTVVIPFDNDSTAYKAVYEEALKQKEDGEGETEHHHSEDEEEDHDETITYMYFWYDYIEGYDTYSKTVSGNEDYDQAVASKILMKFNIEDPYFPNKDENAAKELCSSVNLDANGDGQATPAEVRDAYNTARYFVNLLNSSELEYHVEFIYEAVANLWVDSIVATGTHLTIAWSNTYKAVLIAILVIALLLVIFYRFGALSAGTISVLSAFAGVGVLALLNVEFSIAALIGLISVVVCSLASNIVYLNKLKEECYKGRSLKKANSEAYRRSILPIVDIHVVLILIGAFCYLLGGAIMKSFAVVAVLGGIVSLVLNTFIQYGLMWLSTNATYLNGKYEWFGVSKEQVPDLMNEEKQSYYGAYSDKDFTKKKKPFGIVAACLFAVALGGMIVSGCLTNGAVYRQANTNAPTEIFMEMETTASDNDVLEASTRSAFTDAAEYITIGGKKLSEYVVSSDMYNRTDVVSTKDGAETYLYSYYVVTLNKSFKGDETAVYDKNGMMIDTEFNRLLGEDYYEMIGFDAQVTVTVRSAKLVSKDVPNYSSIMLATFVGVAAGAIYLLLRYRLSRGIATLLATCAVGGITAGLFAVLPLGVGSYVVLAVPAVCLFTMILEIMFMNKERELVIEDKAHDKSVENRNEIMVKAGQLNGTPLIIFSILVVYLAINFFGFGANGSAWLFLNILFGVACGAVMVAVLFGPLAQVFYKLFSKVKIDRPTKKKKKVVTQKSAEPEEAIFIGIND